VAGSLLHKEAPEFVRTDLKHRKLDLHAYRGKIVLLDFWACRRSSGNVVYRPSAGIG